jgi:hypothetical protein
MTQQWLVGTLASLMLATTAVAQTASQGQVPAGETALGSVRIPRAVMADGKPLSAGTYNVRLTTQPAQPQVAGQLMERWVEFVQGGQVRGREVVSIVPAAEMKDLNSGAKGPRPAAGSSRVEMLKGDEYLRVWINRGGVNYLIHMPPSGAATR